MKIRPLFEVYLESLVAAAGSERTIITGDFNLNLSATPFTRLTTEYYELLTSFGYRNCIDRQTYVSPSSAADTSCLDHMWFNFRSLVYNGRIFINLQKKKFTFVNQCYEWLFGLDFFATKLPVLL